MTVQPAESRTGNTPPGEFKFDMDERLSLAPLDPETALRALMTGREMSDEIDADSAQAERLASARQHVREGALHWDEDNGDPSTASE
jgi:hypothetical protein